MIQIPVYSYVPLQYLIQIPVYSYVLLQYLIPPMCTEVRRVFCKRPAPGKR